MTTLDRLVLMVKEYIYHLLVARLAPGLGMSHSVKYTDWESDHALLQSVALAAIEDILLEIEESNDD